jgi:hypothetical protein
MLSIVVHTYNSSTEETEAGESQIPGQPRLCSKTLSPKKKKEREKKRKEYICPYRERGHPSVQPIKLLKDFLS